MREVDLAVIGGGPAGMAAALEASKCGVKDIVILERDHALGGILPQCVHNGFGLHAFGEELTGPEYAWRFARQILDSGIETKLDTMVLEINADKVVKAVNSVDGLIRIKAKAIILSMGCRERTRGALGIPGSRPSGIYTAGTAQRFVNIEGYMPGKKVVILGSGDVGLIMARRLTLEGAEVKMVCELMPYPGGLKRNIVQCLEDFDIPLRLMHTVVRIHGNERLEGVTVARVDEKGRPEEGTFEFVECDTLLLSVGLIPENELTRQASIKIDESTSGPFVDERTETSQEGIFACGNVVYVHDLADHVTLEGCRAGKSAAEYIFKDKGAEISHEAPTTEVIRDKAADAFRILPREGVRCAIPQCSPISEQREITCIVCPLGCRVEIIAENGKISGIRGNTCKRGADYAEKEYLYPTRMVTTTVRVKDGRQPLVPVKTDRPVPRDLIMDCMKEINKLAAEAPVKVGDILLRDILNTGANIVATSCVEKP